MIAFKKYTYLICFVLPPLVYLATRLGGLYFYSVPILVFVLLPILDLLIGKDSTNPSEDEVPDLQNQKFYRYLTYLWAFLQVGFVIWATIYITQSSLEIYEGIGFLLSIGIITGGIGFTVGHELGHKNTKWEQFLSKMIYMTVSYMHFFIEHNKGHHVNVSTPDDPATSRLGESFYRFLPRTIWGGLKSAWDIETTRLNKKNLSAFHYRNEMLWYPLVVLAFSGFLLLVSFLLTHEIQWIAIGFFYSQSLIAIILLESVNYIEHYGLKRREFADGKFERVQPIHSWNANHFLSNALLFHLQRHSDHHANAGRRYQALRHFEESPQLPAGYEVMILVAMVPPLWRKIMNPILENWKSNRYEKIKEIAVEV
ncbi:alkane 1-monooxygenase [Leptospira sp. GIMC2001]|uniref:alkane 1-monooxygenase n=1 Tax=Leptospira sp. GIMC2001 TaxID=1513297 RepID=UPI00234ADBEC|nr:alkane 1-monooxygenase [Leptospira sp. GIMC2001]WCL48327.1 alkane 1-monooxygenase [Leptospira sp. GIMC2001]